MTEYSSNLPDSYTPDEGQSSYPYHSDVPDSAYSTHYPSQHEHQQVDLTLDLVSFMKFNQQTGRFNLRFDLKNL